MTEELDQAKAVVATLTAEIDALRAALAPFVADAKNISDDIPDPYMVVICAPARNLRRALPLPPTLTPQQCRQKWRALLLTIKAKFAGVDSEIETLEEAFLAHVVLSDGSVMGDYAKGALEQDRIGKQMPPLLEGPKR